MLVCEKLLMQCYPFRSHDARWNFNTMKVPKQASKRDFGVAALDSRHTCWPFLS